MEAYSTRRHDHDQLINVRGEIDLATTDELLLRLQILVGATPGRIELDLTQVTFMDCTGLRSLIIIDHLVRSTGGTVHVVAVSLPIARLLMLVGRQGRCPAFLTSSALDELVPSAPGLL